MCEMTPQDLFDLIKEFNQGDEKETVESVTDLLQSIRNDVDSYCNKLDTILEEFADDNNICVICGEELQFITDLCLPEYQCNPVGQRVCSNGCES